MMSAVWAYRGFILGSVKREFQVRYLGSLLGSVWTIIAPISMMVVYLVIFSQIMRAKLPGVGDTLGYGLFLCAGIFTWTYYTEVLSRCMTIFIEQSGLLKKSPFPRTTLPIVVLLSSTLNFVIVFGLFVLFLAVTSRFPGPALIAMVPLLVIQQGLAVGLGVFLGVFNVFFRDVAQAMNIVLQFWFWFTPIVYPPSIVPERFLGLIRTWNPMFRIIEAYQGIILTGAWPEPRNFIVHALLAAGSLILAYVAFRRLSGEMVDEL